MGDITVTLRFNEDGSISLVDKAKGKLGELQQESEKAAGAGKNVGSSLMEMKAGVDILSGAVTKVTDFAADLYKTGNAARQVEESFSAIAGSNAAAYIDEMTAATKGLIDDTDLAQVAMKALTLKTATTGDELASLARDGAILGKVMYQDAAGGINALNDTLAKVGQTRGLLQLGLDAKTVEARFEELRKTMSDKEAWHMAVFEEASLKANKFEGALDGAGTAMQRVQVRFDEMKEDLGKGFAFLIDQSLNLAEALGQVEARRVAAAAAKTDQFPQGIPVNYNNGDYRTGNNTGLNREMLRGQSMAQIFTNMGISPEDYFRMMAGSQYGDLAGQNRAALETTPNLTSTIYTNFRTTSPNYAADMERQRRDAEIRDRQRAYYASLNMTGTGGGIYAQQAMERFADADKFNTAQKVLGGLNNLLSAGAGAFDPYAQGIKTVTDAYAKMSDEMARRKAIQSIDQAFGVEKDGLYGEIGGGLAGSLQDRRQAEQERLEKRYGKGSKKVEQGLNAFDRQSKTEMDEFAIKTGSATKASIEFRDILTQVNTAGGKGNITLAQQTRILLDLAEAAKSGKNSYRELENMMLGTTGARAIEGDTTMTRKEKDYKKGLLKAEQRGGGEEDGTEKGKSALSPLIKELDDTKNKTDEIIKSTEKIPGAFKTQMDTAAANVKPLKDVLDGVDATTKRLLALKSNAKITIQISGGGPAPAKGWDVK